LMAASIFVASTESSSPLASVLVIVSALTEKPSC